MKFILHGAGVRCSATGVLLSSRLLVGADPVQVGGGVQGRRSRSRSDVRPVCAASALDPPPASRILAAEEDGSPAPLGSRPPARWRSFSAHSRCEAVIAGHGDDVTAPQSLYGSFDADVTLTRWPVGPEAQSDHLAELIDGPEVHAGQAKPPPAFSRLRPVVGTRPSWPRIRCALQPEARHQRVHLIGPRPRV